MAHATSRPYTHSLSILPRISTLLNIPAFSHTLLPYSALPPFLQFSLTSVPVHNGHTQSFSNSFLVHSLCVSFTTSFLHLLCSNFLSSHSVHSLNFTFTSLGICLSYLYLVNYVIFNDLYITSLNMCMFTHSLQ